MEEYLTSGHSLADDLGVFVDPHLGAGRGEQVLAHFAQHMKYIFIELIHNKTYPNTLSPSDPAFLFSKSEQTLGPQSSIIIFDFEMKNGKIVIDSSTGKLSLARTALHCPRCHVLQAKLNALMKRLVQLEQENSKYSQQEQQMALLC